MGKDMLLFFAIILGIVYLDQLSKWIVVILLKGERAAVVIDGVLQLKYAENTGAAFGMLADHRWVFLVLSSVAIIGVTVYMIKWRPKNKLVTIAVAFIVGGGIGNMIDRISIGYVVDFIDFCAFPDIWAYIFNVADSFVCVGSGLLILYLILVTVKEEKEKKALKNSTDPEIRTSDTPSIGQSSEENDG